MPSLTATERVMTALGHREADRVPFILTLSLHGARELGMGLKEFFSDPKNAIEAQLRMHQRYGHDALLGFLYAALEYEAWGGEAVIAEDGPPRSGSPVFTDFAQLDHLEPPSVRDCPGLQKALEVIRGLKARVGGEVPILGVMISPFSLPVMQLGFERYLDLLFEDRPRFWRLMAANEAFAVEWGNAQFEAGAMALAYYDPLASPNMVPLEIYRETGFLLDRRTLGALRGPTTTHLASARSLDVAELLAQTGTLGVGVSCVEDLSEAKRVCGGRLTVLGNLNGIAMASWSPREAEKEVKAALLKGGPGGGFILMDTHGELPWSVSEEVIATVAETVHTAGHYPLRSA